jgi:hypothetical protein
MHVKVDILYSLAIALSALTEGWIGMTAQMTGIGETKRHHQRTHDEGISCHTKRSFRVSSLGVLSYA